MSVYQHSGKVPGRAALVPFGILGASAVLGFVYSHAVVWIPIVGFVSLLFAAGYVIGMIYVVRELMAWAHVRSRPFAIAMGLLAGVANVWFAWAGFAVALTGGEIGILASFDPVLLAYLASDVAETGWYEIQGTAPTGALTWSTWIVEAGVLAIPMVHVARGLPSRPYCERCGAWADRLSPVLVLGDNPGADVKGAMERLDVSALAGMALPARGERTAHLFEPHACSGCDFRTLSLVHLTVHPPDNNGKTSETRKELSRWRLVTPGDLTSLGEVGTLLSAAAELDAAAP